MLKYLFVIIGCVCCTIVAAEAAGVLFLWQRGMISPHHLHEIRLVLTNRSSDDKFDDEPEQRPQFPSSQQIAQARAVKILNLDKRESELTTLKGMADDKREELETQQKQFRAQRKAFEEDLGRMAAEITSTSTEQARGVLLALPPKEAVQQLMQLSLDQDVVLLKGMPEKSIAKILKEFQATPAPPATTEASGEKKDTPIERGRKIFETLSRGDPSRSLIERTRKALANEGAALD